jgi:hypothetical protein
MAIKYINADTGNDSAPGDGTSAHPWLTIAKAYGSSSANDTIYMQSSTAHYTTPTIVNPTYRYYTAQTLGSVIIDNAGATDTCFACTWSGGAPLYDVGLFTNIIIQNGIGAYYWNYNGNMKSSYVNCIIRNWTVTTGIRSSSIFNLGSHVGFGSQQISFNRCIISLFVNGTGYLMHPSSGQRTSEFSSTLELINSIFVCSGTTASTCVTNIMNTGYAAYTGLTCRNSIFKIGYPVAFCNVTPAALINLNNCYNGLLSYPGGTNNITGDPLFIDEANQNFNLRPASPCIGTGTPL